MLMQPGMSAGSLELKWLPMMTPLAKMPPFGPASASVFTFIVTNPVEAQNSLSIKVEGSASH